MIVIFEKEDYKASGCLYPSRMNVLLSANIAVDKDGKVIKNRYESEGIIVTELSPVSDLTENQ